MKVLEQKACIISGFLVVNWSKVSYNVCSWRSTTYEEFCWVVNPEYVYRLTKHCFVLLSQEIALFFTIILVEFFLLT